ncbi:uncharacterized protein [Argopecten irradians]|uniref:uncharacterized protein isoform X1 n=1 Tax=Argopecten irradians TaxID=31199 RepID=UPI003721BFB3
MADDVLSAIQRNIRTVSNQLLQGNPNRHHLRDIIRHSKENLDRVSSIDALQFVDVHAALDDLLALADRDYSTSAEQGSAVEEVQLEETRSHRARGRPSKEIDLQFVKTQLQHGFTAKAIAHQLNCSPVLIYKLLKSHGLSVRDLKYSDISDADLYNTVETLHNSHPNSGNEMMHGFLMAEGIQVQRRRVRETLTAVDPPAAAQRWSQSIRRRVYRVPVPNSLWHIDGHMRLVRWGIATHGCIDGFSRLIIYLRAGTNNKSATVLRLVVDGVLEYGLPSRIRADKGGENVQVALFMNLMREGENGCLTGHSQHNQRVEWLWRDVHKDVIEHFCRTFYELEDEKVLDPDNPIHITAIHLVYLPEINSALDRMRTAWNNHRLRTERNRSPNQIWFEGMTDERSLDHTPVREIYSGSVIRDSIAEKLNSFGLSLQDVEPSSSNQIDDGDRVVIETTGLDLVEDFVERERREASNSPNIVSLREKYLFFVSRISDHDFNN